MDRELFVTGVLGLLAVVMLIGVAVYYAMTLWVLVPILLLAAVSLGTVAFAVGWTDKGPLC